jgi:prepilin-type N-terminal cleavage/methylation domain-containing protein
MRFRDFRFSILDFRGRPLLRRRPFCACRDFLRSTEGATFSNRKSEIGNRKSLRGFTLFEVLIAVGIFAFAAMGLMMALDASLDGARSTQREADVRSGLENRLSRYSSGPLRAGEDDEDENGVHYHAEIGREEVTKSDRTILRGFWRIRVTAKWSDSRGAQEWSLSHLLYRND